MLGNSNFLDPFIANPTYDIKTNWAVGGDINVTNNLYVSNGTGIGT